jgi:hypothetical protein
MPHTMVLRNAANTTVRNRKMSFSRKKPVLHL